MLLLCACQLDAGESDIIGLNHLLQDTLSRHSSPTLKRFLARAFTLVLVAPPTTAAATAGDDSASSAELVSPTDPQSLSALEQLELECAIGWPLSGIVTGAAVGDYNRVWRLLLQVRRAEFALNDCALSGVSAAPHSRANRRAHAAAVASRQGGLPTAGRPLTRSAKYYANSSGCAHAFHLLKSELAHFTRNILEYLLGNCASARWWRGLLRALERHAGSGDVDQLRALHQQYLDNILFHCLLTPKVGLGGNARARARMQNEAGACGTTVIRTLFLGVVCGVADHTASLTVCRCFVLLICPLCLVSHFFFQLSVALDAIKRVLGLCLDLRLLYRNVIVDYMGRRTRTHTCTHAYART